QPGADRALRLGLSLIKGLSEYASTRIAKARAASAFSSLEDFIHRTKLRQDEIKLLAEAGALEALSPGRRNALWKAEAPRTPGLFAGISSHETALLLPHLRPAQQLVLDYGTKGLSIGDHPLRYHRKRLRKLGAMRASDLLYLAKGKTIALAG